MILNLKPQVTVLLLFFIIFITACTKQESEPTPEMEISTYLPGEAVNVVEKVKTFNKQLQTHDAMFRNEAERLEAGEAMWLMEATANYLYNTNAKYKKDRENLTLDFELSFKLEQAETRQPTLSKSAVMEEAKILHNTIESRAKLMNRLPRLIDYEIASVKDGIVNFKVAVNLVTTELRDSYDETIKYGLSELGKVAYYPNNTFDIIGYDCALNQGAIAASDYAYYVTDCLDLNYGQAFATSVATAMSHESADGECYDDGNHNEYAMEGGVWSHGNYFHEDAGVRAIDLWNGDLASFSPPYIPLTPSNPFTPNNGTFFPQSFDFDYWDESSEPFWCIKGVKMGVGYLYFPD